MAGLVPAIHVVTQQWRREASRKWNRVVGRDKPGHDV